VCLKRCEVFADRRLADFGFPRDSGKAPRLDNTGEQLHGVQPIHQMSPALCE
jgi:hypothetical protein